MCLIRMLWWLGAPTGLLLAVGALWGPVAVALGVGQVRLPWVPSYICLLYWL